MTKEPKLQAAVRIVAEWTDYDQEIKRLQTRVQAGVNNTKKQKGTGTGTGTEHSQPATLKSAPTFINMTDVSLCLCQMFT